MNANHSRNTNLLIAAAVFVVLAFGQVAEAQGYQYYALTPCRLVDTRSTPGAPPNQGQVGTSGPIANRTNTLFTSKGLCGIPASGVYAITVNVTAVTPTADGHFRFFPSDIPAIGLFATLNFVANELAVANGAIIPIRSSGVTVAPDGPTGAAGGNVGTGDFGIFLGGGPGGPTGVGTASSHVVVDVTGYFAP